MKIRRTDANQKQLVAQIRKLPSTSVAHIHTVGQGVPDIIIGHRGRNLLVEIKNPNKSPSQRRLTEDEQAFHEGWQGEIHVVETFDDVLKILKIA